MNMRTPEEILAEARKNMHGPKVTSINGHGKQPDRQLHIVEASSLRSRPTKWIWPGYIAAKSQTMLTGRPGLGKSQFLAATVASATTTKPFPGQATAIHEPMNVLMLSDEDAIEETVRPRLEAAGANLDRVKFLRGVIRKDSNDHRYILSEDGDLIKAAVRQHKIGLITIDPITGYFGKTNSHQTTDVRHSLRPLGDVSEETGVSVLTLTHPSKGSGQRAIDQFIGSQAFIAMCRIGLMAIEEVEFDLDGERKETGRFLITCVKNNLAEKPAPIAYRIVPVTIPGENCEGDHADVHTSYLDFAQEAPTVTADEALDRANARPSRESPQLKRALDFLQSFLSGGGKPKKDVEEAAGGQFISPATLRRACDKLVFARRVGGAADQGHWVWELKAMS